MRVPVIRIGLLTAIMAVTAASLPAHQPDALLFDMPHEKVKALNFEAKLVSGERVRLSDHAGKVVFLNFWATWCAPCLAELPSMDRLNRKMADKPFIILAINLRETPAQVAQFAKKLPMSFSYVLDPQGKISTDYGVNGIPLTYIISPKGDVLARAIGPREWDGEDAMDFFAHLMEEVQPGGPAAGSTASPQPRGSSPASAAPLASAGSDS